jgi:hypothetical protein
MKESVIFAFCIAMLRRHSLIQVVVLDCCWSHVEPYRCLHCSYIELSHTASANILPIEDPVSGSKQVVMSSLANTVDGTDL